MLYQILVTQELKILDTHRPQMKENCSCACANCICLEWDPTREREGTHGECSEASLWKLALPSPKGYGPEHGSPGLTACVFIYRAIPPALEIVSGQQLPSPKVLRAICLREFKWGLKLYEWKMETHCLLGWVSYVNFWVYKNILIDLSLLLNFQKLKSFPKTIQIHIIKKKE